LECCRTSNANTVSTKVSTCPGRLTRNDTQQEHSICRVAVSLASCVCAGVRSGDHIRAATFITGSGTPNIKPLDPSQTARLQRIMIPLLRAGDRTRSLKEIRVGVIEDPTINAANAGGGEFYVTTGLLQKANDEQLRGILAHEIAHDDLGHVAKAQVLGTGLNLGV